MHILIGPRAPRPGPESQPVCLQDDDDDNRHNVLRVSRLHCLQDIFTLGPITRVGQPSALPQALLPRSPRKRAARSPGGALLLDYGEASLAGEQAPLPRGVQASLSSPGARWPACIPSSPYRTWGLEQVMSPLCLSFLSPELSERAWNDAWLEENATSTFAVIMTTPVRPNFLLQLRQLSPGCEGAKLHAISRAL